MVQRVEQGGVLSCNGITAAAHPFFAALLANLFPERPVVIITEGVKSQESFHQDVTTWTNLQKAAPSGDQPNGRSTASAARQLLFYPAWEILPHEARLPHPDVISDRLETLIALSSAEASTRSAPIITTNVIALLQRTFDPKLLRASIRTLSRGERIDPLDLVEWLEAQGYEPEAQVTQKGELSLRGGILDIYPLTSPWPVRLEFFGDELESLRQFDPLSQISRDQINTITIPPAGELGILKQLTAHDPEQATAEVHTLIDYLPSNSILLLSEPEILTQRADDYAAQVPAADPFFIPWDELSQRAARKGMCSISAHEAEPRSEPYAQPAEDDADRRSRIFDAPDASNIYNQRIDSTDKPVAFECLRFENLEAFRPLNERAAEPQVAEAQRREFFAQMHRWSRQGYGVHVFCNNEGERQRFNEIWKEYGLSTDPQQSASPEPSPASGARAWVVDRQVWAHQGTLARGFICDQARVVVVTDAEIFGRYKVQQPRRLKSPHAQATRSALDIDFTDLDDGDYVVHLQHGIGRYLGLEVLPIGAGTKPTEAAASPTQGRQECLVIEYAANDPAQPPPKLYVPVTEAHLVSKYVGTGKARPPLNTLGGARWAKAKAHAERAVRDVASELLAIQAARESEPGHAFAPDSTWQREFESAFIYEETPDQMKAIVETKVDMERPKPMDRLICGDVGFGKTEVGIRAAFKAVMDGRQVAVLVPTTVLAQQHYNTFRERMADYPIRVELLSRFRTRHTQQRVVRELAAGGVDIVIGTHRLLQPDIGFKDLGLVVIDEEQRFGVVHKEKFKMLRKLVDVLTLSATPIPRTLYLALTGARDMSTIQTPPHDRLPVETIVTQYDERVIRDAIQRELNRGGQVFFLHNRVMTIDTMAQKLAALVPHARIVVGHGQMHSDDLEEVMTRFVNGEADVLLSTTIIESGLDIPNANTIIIDRADRFGLSDLYQLRGRVGRYKHQAYAYLLLPRHGSLVADVRKRISAIKQYSTLGSGFKIAMRDLEIRGAGNLLGAEQSGHITAVGFELYCQLLKQSVSSLKGEEVKPRIEVQVRLDFLALSPSEESRRQNQEQAPEQIAAIAAAYIPFNYVSDTRQRIEIYRRVAQATLKRELEKLQTEFRDRFGPLPVPLQLLLQIAEIKLLASSRGISVIEVKDDKLMLTRNNDFVMIGNKFPRLTKKEPAKRLQEIKKLLLAL
jgi:transcription-repair coupling factor (superfamily II helicase)